MTHDLETGLRSKQEETEIDSSSKLYIACVLENHSAFKIMTHLHFPPLFLCSRISEPGRVRRKRQTLQEMARPLKEWMEKHLDNPYPSKGEKQSLAHASNMTLVQVRIWLRLKKRHIYDSIWTLVFFPFVVWLACGGRFFFSPWKSYIMTSWHLSNQK